MKERIRIRLLEPESNPRGDLFARLMSDLFIALGYQPTRLNVQKSGRELDLVAVHRLEPRRAIAECKATDTPIGGTDLNKFVGVLDAEHEDQRPVTGYFISLAGFTETAVEQEQQRRRTKLVLLDQSKIVEQLVEGRILISKEHATELAGQLSHGIGGLKLDLNLELLAHERGWFWTIYYTKRGVRSNFALIRSDGEIIPRVIADTLIVADKNCGGELHSLHCLNFDLSSEEKKSDELEKGASAYRNYIANECGFVQFDGLPTDGELSGQLKLEDIYVPLYLDILRGAGAPKKSKKKKRCAVRKVLSKYLRLALLAPPGAGKTTLIKRLAMAYLDPKKREELPEGLPPHDWVPLLFRCRDIRALARSSFTDLLDFLAHREPIRAHARGFRAYVDCELIAGRILLLVDGIDEISDPGDRAAFVCMLRATLLAYPNVAAIVTSREAGFRHVAAHLSTICTQVKLAPFSPDDITTFTVGWFRRVDGDKEEVRIAAEGLAQVIIDNDRIQRLAVNPLLLTTLLLVKRWMGSLPTRRALLYDKAVEVLLMTWNVEGYDPIPQDEALPQLCFVASAMTLSGIQEISRPRLAALLQQARSALPAELGYVEESVDQFIGRIEHRSSLLMMTGQSVEAGRLVEFFEFRHLTFQEFLTARALVQGWHPNHEETDTLTGVLEPHFSEETWREVIPLSCVLSGKAADAVIRRMTEFIQELPRTVSSPETEPVYFALGNCLADEAHAPSTTVRAALRELIRLGSLDTAPFCSLLALGRYGRDLRNEAQKLFLSGTDLRGAGHALMTAVYWQTVGAEQSTKLLAAAGSFNELIKAAEQVSRCEGALGIMALCSQLHEEGRRSERTACSAVLREACSGVVPMLFSDAFCDQWAAAWALVGVSTFRIWAPPAEPDVLGRLLELWLKSPNREVRRLAAWALSRQPICDRDDGRRCASAKASDLDAPLARFDMLSRRREQPALLSASWYLRALDDGELERRTSALLIQVEDRTAAMTLRELLGRLQKTMTSG